MPKQPTTAARITAKQRACPHPPQHVHATYDDRWETCDLCHLIRPRPLPAPWIVAWDESQPAEPAPALFADLTEPTHVPVPTKRPCTRMHAPEPGATTLHEQPATFADLLRAARRDRDILGRAGPWQSPALEAIYTPDQIQTCPRCRGIGTVRDHEELGTGYPWPSVSHVHHPDNPARPCPRCQGAGRIPKYIA